MSIWSGIKYALNSTIGTKNFESLDKMLISNYTLVPSNTVLKEFVKPGETVEMSYTPYQVNFTPNYNGNITFMIRFASSTSIYIKIFEDGKAIIDTEMETNSTNNINLDIEVAKHKKYIIELKKHIRNGEASSISIRGTTIGGRIFAENEVV